MKQFLNVIIVAALSINSAAFAYASDKTKAQSTLVYCPDSVICTEAHNLKSCQHNGGNSIYWDFIGGGGYGDKIKPDVAGTYTLVSVISGYHWPAQGGLTRCVYEHTSTGKYYELVVYANYKSNLEAYLDKDTKWDISEKGYPHPANCKANTAKSCPLTEQSALEIVNNIKDKLLAAINNIDVINEPVLSNANLPTESNPYYGKVVYENALAGCGNVKECKIDIINANRTIIGSVIVDMDNKMKILNINNLSSSGAIIRQVKPFNTVEIISSSSPPTPPPVLPSISIYNKINAPIIATIQGVNLSNKPISISDYATIHSDRVSDLCKSNTICKIDLKTTKGADLGYILIDAATNMNVMQINSLHPSEIIIEQDSTHVVSIKYFYN